MKKYSFPPIVDGNCKVLILGTMPGEISLEKKQYYANPQNQFWKIIGYVTGDNFTVDYEEKKNLLLKNHIAVWDVLIHCEREGSLDEDIKEEYPNDFNSFYKKYPSIKSIYFNGGKAEKLFKRYNLFNCTKSYTLLPSTSSMNTSMTLKKKSEVWNEKMKDVI